MKDFVVAVLGFGPIFVHKSNASEGEVQVSGKLLAWKISLQAKAFDSSAVHKQDSRRPQHIKAVKLCRRLFNVDGDRKEILIDKIRSLLIGVRFGLQPNTSASSRRGAEIKQDWFSRRPGFSQCSLGVFDPLHGHTYPPNRKILNRLPLYAATGGDSGAGLEISATVFETLSGFSRSATSAWEMMPMQHPSASTMGTRLI